MALGTITTGAPLFPRSRNGQVPDEDASASLVALREAWRTVQARQQERHAMATTDTTLNPLTGLAACCNDPKNRRTSTVDPAQVAKAVGGIPGVQLCAVCGRKHYTFTVMPEERRRG